MCFTIRENSRFKIATEDIKCYKVIEYVANNPKGEKLQGPYYPGSGYRVGKIRFSSIWCEIQTWSLENDQKSIKIQESINCPNCIPNDKSKLDEEKAFVKMKVLNMALDSSFKEAKLVGKNLNVDDLRVEATIESGLHAYNTIEDIIKEDYKKAHLWFPHRIYEAIIPKGSIYIQNEKEIVATGLKLTKHLHSGSDYNRKWQIWYRVKRLE